VQAPDAAPKAIVDTLNGDPNGLKREHINEALQNALPALAACFPGSGPPSMGLSFDAEPEGKATNIKVSGVTPDAERCVSATLASLKLPVFQGKSVPVQFPISMFRPAPTPPRVVTHDPNPAPVAGAAPVAAPPPPGTSTAPYVPSSSLQATPGSTPSNDQVKTFIQP
jgi:hypothetical protein